MIGSDFYSRHFRNVTSYIYTTLWTVGSTTLITLTYARSTLPSWEEVRTQLRSFYTLYKFGNWIINSLDDEKKKDMKCIIASSLYNNITIDNSPTLINSLTKLKEEERFHHKDYNNPFPSVEQPIHFPFKMSEEKTGLFTTLSTLYTYSYCVCVPSPQELSSYFCLIVFLAILFSCYPLFSRTVSLVIFNEDHRSSTQHIVCNISCYMHLTSQMKWVSPFPYRRSKSLLARFK